MFIMTDSLSKSEIVSALIRLSVLSIGTYFSIKWVFKHMDPTQNQKRHARKRAQQQLMKIGIYRILDFTDYEVIIASHLVDPTDISVTWTDIAGLDEIIEELKENIILPVQRKDLFFDSHLIQPPKGVLLYGPPGCGKTMIAKATARETGMRFINLDVSILTDKWYGESQKLASAVFSLAMKLQPCIIFIDEIDSFLRNRNAQDHEATAMMKAQFMSLWDGLITDSDCTVIIMGATNRPADLDRAIARRMPAKFFIALPNVDQRFKILKLILRDEQLADNVDFARLSSSTDGFSGSDLRELCRSASIYRIRDFVKIRSRSVNSNNNEEELRPLSMLDFTTALEKMKESKIRNEAIGSIG